MALELTVQPNINVLLITNEIKLVFRSFGSDILPCFQLLLLNYEKDNIVSSVIKLCWWRNICHIPVKTLTD